MTYRFDVGNEHALVADVDAQTLIKLVKFLNPIAYGIFRLFSYGEGIFISHPRKNVKIIRLI